MSTEPALRGAHCRRCGARLIRGVNLHYLRAGDTCTACFYGQPAPREDDDTSTRASLHAAIMRAARAPAQDTTMVKAKQISMTRAIPGTSRMKLKATHVALPRDLILRARHVALDRRTSLRMLVTQALEQVVQQAARPDTELVTKTT